MNESRKHGDFESIGIFILENSTPQKYVYVLPNGYLPGTRKRSPQQRRKSRVARQSSIDEYNLFQRQSPFTQR